MMTPRPFSFSKTFLRHAATADADRPVPGNASLTISGAMSGSVAGTSTAFAAQARENTPTDKSWRQYLVLGTLAVLAHGAAVLGYSSIDRTPPVPLKQTVEIELIRPVIVPPQEIEPPKPPPPPPPKKVVRKTPPPPPPVVREEPAPVTLPPPPPEPPVEEIIAEEPLPMPPVEAPPPPAPVEEPVSEPMAYAAYLSNPAPKYPTFAQKQGWEGKVLLRVHVLANGKPDKLEIAQSSGRKTLDDAALAAVRNWTFVPAKRGSMPIDGWTTVPIEFRLAK